MSFASQETIMRLPDGICQPSAAGEECARLKQTCVIGLHTGINILSKACAIACPSFTNAILRVLTPSSAPKKREALPQSVHNLKRKGLFFSRYAPPGLERCSPCTAKLKAPIASNIPT